MEVGEVEPGFESLGGGGDLDWVAFVFGIREQVSEVGADCQHGDRGQKDGRESG